MDSMIIIIHVHCIYMYMYNLYPTHQIATFYKPHTKLPNYKCTPPHYMITVRYEFYSISENNIGLYNINCRSFGGGYQTCSRKFSNYHRCRFLSTPGVLSVLSRSWLHVHANSAPWRPLPIHIRGCGQFRTDILAHLIFKHILSCWFCNRRMCLKTCVYGMYTLLDILGREIHLYQSEILVLLGLYYY